MTQRSLWLLVACLSANLLHAAPPLDNPQPKAAVTWNPKSAAAYLDQRANWWMAWPPAKRDHATFCISCHTALPYALSRSSLHTALAEKTLSAGELRVLENVTTRVRLWNEIQPFYGGNPKAAQSRGTESVLNALILVSADAANGKLSADTQTALTNMWALQQKDGDLKGAWNWLNFGNEPFEAPDSQYYGAALAAVAVGMAPENYRSSPEIQKNLQLLGDYLRRESDRQPLIHQVVALWASTKWPALLPPAKQQAIIDSVLRMQQSDGGWGLSSMGWTWRLNPRSLVDLWIRSNDTPWAGKSDGYATGLIVFVFEQMSGRTDSAMQRGRTWLLQNQDQAKGQWPGYSLVNRRDPTSGTGLFMSDAATAYAVLALTGTKGR